MEKYQDGRRIARRVALYGMLVALAFIFSYVEAMVPVPIPVPGIKLGLANLVTVVGLYTVGIPGAAVVSLIRIVLMGFTFGNLFSMAYSMAGGIFCLLVMAAAVRTGWFSKVGVSILGGIFHNVGQLCAAAWVTKTAGVFTYLPVLLVAGVIAGAVIGLLGGIIVERIGAIVKKL